MQEVNKDLSDSMDEILSGADMNALVAKAVAEHIRETVRERVTELMGHPDIVAKIDAKISEVLTEEE